MEKLDSPSVGLQKFDRGVPQALQGRVAIQLFQECPGCGMGAEEERRRRMGQTASDVGGLFGDCNLKAALTQMEGSGQSRDASTQDEHLPAHEEARWKRERSQTPAASARRWLGLSEIRGPKIR